MILFKIESPVGKFSKKHLDDYNSKQAIGYTVITMDDSFPIHEWCLVNSDILLELQRGMIYKMLSMNC